MLSNQSPPTRYSLLATDRFHRSVRWTASIRLRQGVTVAECVIAGTLWATALMTMGLVHQRMMHGVTRVRTMDTVRTALLNARAEIGSWPASEVTVERIRNLPVPRELQSQATALAWSAQVQPWRPGDKQAENVVAQRVLLTLQWQEPGRSHAPALQQSLTFWVQP